MSMALRATALNSPVTPVLVPVIFAASNLAERPRMRAWTVRESGVLPGSRVGDSMSDLTRSKDSIAKATKMLRHTSTARM